MRVEHTTRGSGSGAVVRSLALLVTASVLLTACGSDGKPVADRGPTAEEFEVDASDRDDLPEDVPQDVTLPELAGLSRDEAESVLTQRDLAHVFRETEADDGTDAGTVLRSEPRAGAVVDESDVIIVWVAAALAADADGGAENETAPREKEVDEPSGTTDTATDDEPAGEQPSPTSPSSPTGTVSVDDFSVASAGLTWRFAGFDDFFLISLGVIINYAGTVPADTFKVAWTLRDGAGNALDSGSTFIDYALPGQTIYFGRQAFLDAGSAEPVSVDARIIQVDRPFARAEQAPTFVFESLRLDGDDNIRGQATHDGPDTIDLYVTCVTIKDGRATGGGFTFVDGAPSHQSVGFRMGNGPLSTAPTDAIGCSAWNRRL